MRTLSTLLFPKTFVCSPLNTVPHPTVMLCGVRNVETIIATYHELYHDDLILSYLIFARIGRYFLCVNAHRHFSFFLVFSFFHQSFSKFFYQIES